MKTGAIRTCIQFRREYETDSGIHIAQSASTELAALKEENARLRETIQSALRIDCLWIPAIVDEEHAEEVKALHIMRQEFLDALSSALSEDIEERAFGCLYTLADPEGTSE